VLLRLSSTSTTLNYDSVVYFADFEIERQTAILEAGNEVVNETRAFNVETGYSLLQVMLTFLFLWHGACEICDLSLIIPAVLNFCFFFTLWFYTL